MTAFVVAWAGLELRPPALELSDRRFVLPCLCSAPGSLAVPWGASSGLCTNVLVGIKETLSLPRCL